MSKVRLKVLGLSCSQTQSGAYALILSEENGNRRIPIVIGGFEAQAIAIGLERLHPPRPLTHDLFINFAQTFNISITEVNIYHLEEGIFYSELVCMNNGSYMKIDARTSDAVALAIRCNCPIYTTEQIIDKAGIVFNVSEEQVSEQPETAKKEPQPTATGTDKYEKLSVKELKKLLSKSISNEDYEEASHIRDEIQRREGGE
ncbi:MAG: bifunctional nuclease family protein [Salinivirgaceae bacterium]|nr:bifunctional nuclease family protein [Salinivirgaceae bacterium]